MSTSKMKAGASQQSVTQAGGQKDRQQVLVKGSLPWAKARLHMWEAGPGPIWHRSKEPTLPHRLSKK